MALEMCTIRVVVNTTISIDIAFVKNKEDVPIMLISLCFSGIFCDYSVRTQGEEIDKYLSIISIAVQRFLLVGRMFLLSWIDLNFVHLSPSYS